MCLFGCVLCWAPRESLAEYECVRVVSFAAISVALSNGYMLARDLRLFVCLFRCVPCWAPRESLAEFQCVRIVRDQIGSFLLVMIARDLIFFALV